MIVLCSVLGTFAANNEINLR